MATNKTTGCPFRVEDSPHFLLYALSREGVNRVNDALRERGLSYTQYIVLAALSAEDNITVRELGDRLRLDSGTLSPLLKKLTDKGLTAKKRNEKDERRVKVSITEKGRSIVENAVGPAEEAGKAFATVFGQPVDVLFKRALGEAVKNG